MKKLIAYFLAITLFFTNIGIVRASEITDNIPDLILSDIEIKEFNTYLNQLKNNKDELNGNSIQSRSVALTGPLGFLAGSFSIPGVGPVVITIGGAIIVAGVTVKATSAIGKKVSSWVFKYKFDKSAKDAVKNTNANKRHHILASKHNWNKFNKKPDWNNVGPLIVKALQDGSEKSEGRNIFVRTLVYKGKTIQVRFIKDANGLIKALSTAWVK